MYQIYAHQAYRCKIKDGFEFSRVCAIADINECASDADNCDNCTNTPDSFTCTCNQGYNGNGLTCVGEYNFKLDFIGR